jgi:hypothetical protein
MGMLPYLPWGGNQSRHAQHRAAMRAPPGANATIGIPYIGRSSRRDLMYFPAQSQYFWKTGWYGSNEAAGIVENYQET